MNIETLRLPQARILWCKIEHRAGITRREAERAATAALAQYAFGSGATVEHHPDGAPYIACDGVPQSVEISISHCRTTAVLAVSANGRRIGVDIEQQRAQLLTVAPRFLSPAEQHAFSTPAQLLEAWTLKEAIYKAAPRPGVDFATHITLVPAPAFDGRPFAVIASLTINDALLTAVQPL